MSMSGVSQIKGAASCNQVVGPLSLLLEDVAQCWGTKPGVNLHKPKLNLSDFQVSRAGIF
jgi:hypothetical protein